MDQLNDHPTTPAEVVAALKAAGWGAARHGATDVLAFEYDASTPESNYVDDRTEYAVVTLDAERNPWTGDPWPYVVRWFGNQGTCTTACYVRWTNALHFLAAMRHVGTLDVIELDPTVANAYTARLVRLIGSEDDDPDADDYAPTYVH